MIYLSPENRSAFGDETFFWVWLKGTYKHNFVLPQWYGETDVVLRYSTRVRSFCQTREKIYRNVLGVIARDETESWTE